MQGGFGLTEDRGGFKFLLIGGHAGRILTPQLGKGLLKGNFEYGVEVFPLWQSYTPKFQRAKCTQIFPAAGPSGTYVSCSAEYTVGGRPKPPRYLMLSVTSFFTSPPAWV